MEKQKLAENAELTWLKDWSEYLTQAPFNLRERNSAQIAALLQALIEASLQGDSGLAISSAMLSEMGDFILHEQQAETQIAPMIYDGELLALYRYWSLEHRLSNQIARLSKQFIEAVAIEAYQDLLTDPYQQAALSMVASQTLNIITGGPGTGKTYTLARIIAVLNQAIPDIRIAMAAPTGKAAQRMQEALQASFNDEKLVASGLVTASLKQQSTQTLHRLLGLGNRQVPRFHSRQPLPYDVIVIDEASMLDLNLATLLLEAIPLHCRVILLGDAKQLASVDVGSVLADLQLIPKLAKHRINLQNSRRFSADAKIGQLARFIQSVDNELPAAQVLQQFEQEIVVSAPLQNIELTPSMSDVVQLEYIPEAVTDVISYYERLMLGFRPFLEQLKAYQQMDYAQENIEAVIQAFDQYRILVAIRFGNFGLEQMNRYAEQWLTEHLSVLPVGGWYVGRPVMMTYNDYQLGISNGDIGLCFRHRIQPELYEVYFPSLNKWVAAHRLPKNIQTAFALTIHKSQGSEFAHTAVVFDHSAEKLLSQELIYTAITRAKKVISLLVDRGALAQALTVQTTRKSGLVRKINKKIGLLS
ncbi:MULTISPECIES: exodeoxyribonuclease V subunit alpha [unclassified Acinetobacter]|uniref:exodeoxyribonuclease V subunit alpha n=1 Tax=unclassified Acinetobacter TaxID=196816 RepID=UPI00190C74A0|nr:MULTISPECIES: exodeoxyribonuclease V subunit alpha [unclassified Acinetobacter]MBK0062799.1 exodeoxyribonuclease V subunit alpha [Acinetobacter sp. S55]MBK0065624.1 exodeoxyribonuclease V subunit alpha [Acinetobacter sp. S54]